MYTMLRSLYEMKGVSFLWIRDLSLNDPLLVLLMGAGMFFQQKITNPDPSQNKMMVFMPVFFVVLLWKISAALVLYWLTNSILTLTEHLIISNYKKRKQKLANS